MKSFAATEAKHKFATLLDDARLQPITIERHGRPVAVILSPEEYARLESIEDVLLASRADAVIADGDWAGSEASQQALRDILDVEA